MVIKSQTTRIILFIITNILLFILLYNIPVENNHLLENLCIYKLITGKECYNCGMTRAFLSVIQGNFDKAIYYNANSIVVFPFTIFIYLYSWYKYINMNNKNEF